MDNREGKTNTSVNLGSCHLSQGKYPKSLELLEEARLIFVALRNLLYESNAIVLIGNWHVHFGNAEKAILYLEQVLAIKEKIGDLSGLTEAKVGLATCYEILSTAGGCMWHLP